MNNCNALETISHQTYSQVPHTEETQKILDSIKVRLKKSNDLFLSLDETLKLTDELSSFDLGIFLLHNRGLNGYWTAYIFRHDPKVKVKNPLESWLLNKSLLVVARERFHKFQEILQSQLKSGIAVASVPCGLMDDFISLDYTNINDVRFTGIDIDQESIELAKQNAKANHLVEHTEFVRQDAWSMSSENKFDVLASNGLNMYESNRVKLISLYRNFNRALKKDGKLIISFLLPPPSDFLSEKSCKRLSVNRKDLVQEIAIFNDILQIKYLNFCSVKEMKAQLTEAGFRNIEIVYTRENFAPIAIALK